MLTEQTRYRVTGTIFLVALAAIFVPMLFDEEPSPLIAPEPGLAPEPDVTPDDSPAPDMTRVVEAGERLAGAVDADGYARETGTRFGEPVLVPEPAVVAPQAAAQDGAAPPRQDDSPEEAPAWAVQVGSYEDPNNAAAQRDRLRADGYSALVSNYRRGDVRATRVAVGPLISREQAAQLEAELERRYGLDAVVTRFAY